MPNPYPILETYLSQGYSVEFSMGDDRWFYIVASHPAKGRVEAGGKTISDSVIMLDSRLKDRVAVEHSVQRTCSLCGGKKKMLDSAGYPVNCPACGGSGTSR